MPLSRYQIRNEFSLADPELYKTADKDDPEALLEGVAMAGLVGVLRQLGDLSEFAAEVFHNLHEEVMATAARGYNLRDRVQQLEVEFPFIEKAFLSQTNHSDFFYTAGVDWHLNTRIDRNYITREDLPRFVMDSYEEARGPPRLFLLDKYDVSGDWACLKRYTDPSFYSVEAAALGITNADVQRDKKVRKGKRRASRWSNGETPEVIPTPHAKLHQLLLEERIANSAGDPARRVKLKRRLNGFPFDLKTSKSYMEQILTPPPQYSQLHEVCYSSPLKLLEMDDIASEGLDVELTHRSPSMSPDFKEGVRDVHRTEMESETSNESDCFNPKFVKDEVGLKNPSLQLIHTSSSVTPDTKDSVQNISIDEQESEAFGIESREFPKANGSLEGDYVTSTLYEDVVEKQIMVDKEGKSELSTSYQSDDVASEVENYIDALATMELEMETDSELHVPSVRNQIAGLDAASPSCQAHISDFQSDDGSSSSKKCKSDPLYSCSPRILAKEAHMDAEVSDDIDTSNGTGKVKSISSPLKWRGRTRNLGGRKVTPIPTYSSDDIEKTSSNTDISPGFFVHRDADASAGENEVSQLTSGMLPAEGTEPSNATESESNASLDVPCGATSSATPLQTKYHSSSQVSVETHSSDNGEDSHLMEHSSSKPFTSDDTCITGGSKDQHMEEVVDKHIYLLPDVTPASCILDGAPLDSEENLSSSHNDNQRMSEHPSNALPQELFENGLHEDLPNDESGAREVLGVLYRASVHPSTCIVDTAEEEMSESSVQNMPQAGDGENDFVMHPVVNQIDLQVTSMPPEEEQTMEPRLPELENINKAISTQYLNLSTNAVKPVSPPPGVALEEIHTSPFQRDLCYENLRISGMTDILQPLDPVDSSMDSQIEEQFPDMADEQYHVTPLSETEICSDAADFNVTIPGERVATLPAGEIAVDMEDEALCEILKGGDTRDILQAQVVLGSVPQLAVKTSDNGDEISHELPSLADRVETYVAPAGETVVGTESLIVKPEIWALNEMHTSVTADDMLLHNTATVETSPNQIINLHELAEKLEGVSSSTNLDERSITDCDSVAENAYTSDAIVKGGVIESNQYGLDAGVPFSVTYGESGTEEKNNIQKVALQLMNYDHSESIIPEKLSNSSSESESSLNTDIRGSSTLEHNEFHMNGVRADDDTIMPIYTSPEERKVNFPLHQLDEEETEVFRNPGEPPHMLSNFTDPSVLEQSESSSKWVHCEKSVLAVYNQDASPISIDHDGEEQKVTMSHRLNDRENQVLAVAGQSDVMLEPQLVEETKSNLLGQEGISGIASISFSSKPGQQSHPELLPQEKPAIDDVGQYHNSLGSVPPVFGLLSEEVHTDPVEIPPLPPLPPVQWRMGKNQQDYLAHEEAVLPNNSIFFPSMSLFTADQTAETVNLNLPAHADPTENSLLIYESMPDTLDHDRPSSLQVPLATNQANINRRQALGEAQLEDRKLPFPGSNSNHLSLGESQSLDTDLSLSENGADLVVTEFYSPSQNSLLPANNKFPSINETQSLSQNLPLPAKLDEMPRHDDHTSNSSNAYSSGGTNGDAAAAACDDELVVVDSATLVQFNQAQETSQNKILDQGSASSVNESNRDTSAHEKKIENERPHVMMLGLEGEVMWAVQDEGRPYGVRPMKLPRQRNPLIDAVIAVDKSKLRKVTEQPKTRMKADNRDSELENLQLRRVTEQTRVQMQKADERDSIFENLQLRKVSEWPRTQIQKPDGRDSVLENLQLRKITKQPSSQMQSADGRDSVLESLQLRKVTEQPRSQMQSADGRDSVLENRQLREVTEQPSSEMQSADERDSLLEQIRAKTFHLKPTVVSRPVVQGPTNLKVAAILEKAKTIRQAFAGSDEDDDDDDSWSDS